jgi:four helix bundle protein
MKHSELLLNVPNEITDDRLWNIEAYRLGLFIGDVSWHDATKLVQDKRTLDLSDQLYRAVGSISANLAEGYSRGTGKDRARFYEYALGSARESRDWYYKGRHILGEEVTTHRLRLLAPIIRLLLTMIPEQRGRVLREDGLEYQVNYDNRVGPQDLDTLLENVPFP